MPLDGPSLTGLLMHLAQCLQSGLLANAPFRRLHELEDADAPALIPAAQGHPEGRGGFSLALPLIDDHHGPVTTLLGGQPVIGHSLWGSLSHQATSLD